jgi:hypothetical protein
MSKDYYEFINNHDDTEHQLHRETSWLRATSLAKIVDYRPTAAQLRGDKKGT